VEMLGHFWTPYANIDALKNHFIQQLDKLARIMREGWRM
jgi:hypothetical protein